MYVVTPPPQNNSDPNYKSTECVFVSINLPASTLKLSCAYIPPNRPSRAYSNFYDTFDKVMSNANNWDNILLIGDFNVPDADWSSVDAISTSISPRYMKDLASTYGLRQINAVCNLREIWDSHLSKTTM